MLQELERYFYLQHNSHDAGADDDLEAVSGLDLGMTFTSIDEKGQGST